MTQSIQVLHVDDDPGLREITATFLERENDQFAVETATSAAEGLDSIRDRPPDCIISDYDMPGQNGIEFLQSVRNDWPDLPFILFTGKGSEKVASDAISNGATDYLQKGSGTDRYKLLANRVENAVENYWAHQQLEIQKQQYQRLFEQAPVMYAVTEENETQVTIVDCNEQFLDRLGYGHESVIGEQLGSFYTDESEKTLHQGGGYDRAVAGEFISEERAFLTADGERVETLLRAVPRVDKDGNTIGTLALYIDITERKKRQRELRILQQAIDDANMPISLADPSQEDNPLVYVNNAYKQLTGYSEKEALGGNCRYLQGESTDPETVATLREAIDDEEPITVELRNYRKDGTEFWNRLTITPIYDDDGSLIRYLGNQQDVTERKERERELETERRFVEQSLNALEDLFYVLDTDGTIRRWNDRVPDITGYTESELDGMDATKIFSEDEQERIANAISQTLTGDRMTVEADLETADGDRIPYEWTGTRLTDVDGRTTGLVGIGRNLTERRQRERRFQALVEESDDIVSVLDANGVFEYQSPSVERVLGYDSEETIGDTAWEYIHPDDRKTVMDTFEEWVANPDLTATVEYRAQHADGSWRWLEARGNNQLDNPAVEGYIVNSRDITERKEREGELRQLKEEYQSVVENVQDSLFLWEVAGNAPDHEFALRWVNPANASQLGVSAETVRGKTPTEIFGEETGCQVTDNYQRSIDRGETVSYEERLDVAGEERQFETKVTPVEVDGEVTQIVGVAHDITERLEWERELERQNERLDEFASIVSHDLQSPLTVAKGHLELAQEACESDHLVHAADAVGRSQALIEDLLTLAREGDDVSEVNPVALADVAESSWRTVESQSTTLETHTTQVIQADQSRLKQLFENLYRNAVEHGGDDVTVSVGSMDGGFYVADTGPSVPESDREKIFEAGYSTAEEGTGFGLRIVKQIVEAHGWAIRVTDSDNDGARFEITGVDTSE